MEKIKYVHRQDSGFKLSAGNSGETSLNLSNEIFDLITKGSMKLGEERNVTFKLYKEDCIKAVCFIILKLPLYQSSSNASTKVVDNLIVFQNLIGKINYFFGENEIVDYTVNLYYRTDGRIYLNRLKVDGFSIRDVLVENNSALLFKEESNGKIALRILSDIKDGETVDAVEQEIQPSLPLQQIFYGAPGTGKSHETNETTRKYPDTIRTTFHPDSDYSTFVGAYKPTMEKAKNRQIILDYARLLDRLKDYLKNDPTNVTRACTKFGFDYHDSIVHMLDNGYKIPSLVTAATGSSTATYDTNIRAGMYIYESSYSSCNLESKIVYKFIKQAFLKAYILAWKKMGAADVTTNPLQPSATPAKSLTFTKGLATYTLLTMDDSCVSFKKEEPFGKSPVENTWHKLWSSGSFEIPEGSRSGATFQEAVSRWIYNREGAAKTENDFEQGWNELISLLKIGKQIKAENNNGNQVYYLSYNGNEDSVKKTSEDKAYTNAIEKAYNGDTSQNASAKGIAEILHSYSSDFDKAWEQLKTVLLNGGQQTTNPTETIAIQPQFLIIEEINRGNCAQIFGDIFQLLDRTDNGYSQYPIEADEDIQKALLDPAPADGLSFGPNGLQLSDAIKQQLKALNDNCPDEIVSKVCCGQLLVLPPNLHIWATMNTSDQSLFPIDSAFKRRWDWEYVPIVDAGENWVIDVRGDKYNWWTFLEKVNQIINTLTSSEDKKLGYFFAKAKGKVVDTNTLVNKVFFYLWNDVFKDYDLGHVQDFPKTKDTSKTDSKERPYSFGDFFDKVKGEINEKAVADFMNQLLPTTDTPSSETAPQEESAQ